MLLGSPSLRQTRTRPQGLSFRWRQVRGGLRRILAQHLGLGLSILGLYLSALNLSLRSLDLLGHLLLLVAKLADLIAQAEQVFIVLAQPRQFIVFGLRQGFSGVLRSGSYLQILVVLPEPDQLRLLFPVGSINKPQRHEYTQRAEPRHH